MFKKATDRVEIAPVEQRGVGENEILYLEIILAGHFNSFCGLLPRHRDYWWLWRSSTFICGKPPKLAGCASDYASSKSSIRGAAIDWAKWS